MPPRLPQSLRLTYNLTQEFGSLWFSLIAYAVAFIGFVGLIPLNYKLTGYETVTVTQSSIPTSPVHWYNSIVTPPEILCDPHMLNAGDTFFTNYGIFTWTLNTIFDKPALASQPEMAGKQLTGAQMINITDVLPSIEYNGYNLSNCDYSGIRIVISPSPPIASFTAGVVCNGNDFPVMISTAFNMDATNIFNSSLGTIWGSLAPGANNLGGNVQSLLLAALSDIGQQAVSFIEVTGNNPTGASYPPPSVLCYNQQLGQVDESCAKIPPLLTPTTPATLMPRSAQADVKPVPPDGQGFAQPAAADGLNIAEGVPAYQSALNNNATTGIGNWINQTVTLNNAAQLIVAAIRLDIGNIFSNNLLVSPNTLNATITPTYTNSSQGTSAPSSLYSALNQFNTGDQNWTVLNMNAQQLRPAVIATQYLCHVPQRKPVGQLVMSVLVATLSIFSTGWKLLTLALTYLELHKQ
ncbi:hypothetical protein FRB96_001993 [Tulasnella sp. 330]|nr:hypothetical protein FRB96_001993 [Tulasnella sp. 330]KAG8870762.1 hypothetical protein FRB97_009380 [Tulasnella sp. 331]KAG8870955.1 hypothetical protein FRB98_001234 [Tulasnella sp. 332]